MSTRLYYKSAEPSLILEYIKRTEDFSMHTDHYHASYEIYYLISGERFYFIRDRSYHVRKGDLVFINTRELHKTSGTGGGGHERLVIYFEEEWLSRYYAPHHELLLQPFVQAPPVIRFPVREQVQSEQLIHRLMAEMSSAAPGQELAIRQTVSDLLLLAARHAASSEAEPLDTPLHLKMSEVARYINEHYAEPIYLTALAEQFYLSPYYLSRTFRKAIGLTMNEYLNLVRIRAAEQLLKETDLAVTEIAARVGYDNFSHFGKTFKKITKTSPRNYRKVQ
ncbi:helix-turn-helix domain-containing protein [Paenibacillus sp. 1P07SE]|uniref:AraC family transcriptional regulator n=1 Tax=Paenibacillus sp. 1P07SE TaxID=3132209 RepID=UPI0039A66347